MRQRLPNSAGCYVCGNENPRGLQVRFDVEGGVVSARFVPHRDHCGYNDRVHGGVIAALLDHLWQSTLVAGGIALLTLFFRNNHAVIANDLCDVMSIRASSVRRKKLRTFAHVFCCQNIGNHPIDPQ